MSDRPPTRAVVTCAPVACLLWLAVAAAVIAIIKWVSS